MQLRRDNIPWHLIYSWINFLSKLVLSLGFLFFVSSNFEKPMVNFWLILNSVSLITLSIQNGFIITFTRYLVYSRSGRPVGTFNEIHKSQDVGNLYHKINNQEFSDLLRTLQWVFWGLGVIYLILASSIGSMVLVGPIEKLSNSSQGWLVWMIVLITNTIFISFNVYQIFLEGLNQVKWVQKSLALSNLCGIVALAMVALFVKEFLVVILIQQGIFLLNLLLLKIQAKRRGGIYHKFFKNGNFRLEILKIVWKQAWKNGYTVIMASIVKYSSGIIIGNLFSATNASMFLLTKRFFEIIDSLLVSTTNAFMPKLAEIRVKGEVIKLKSYIQKLFSLVFILYTISYLIFLLLGNEVLSLMSSNVQLASNGLIILFCFSHFLARWGALLGNIGHQANLVLDHISVSIYALIFFAISYFAFPYIGERAFPFGMILGVLISMSLIAKPIYRSYNTTFWKFERNKLFVFSMILIAINCVYYIVSR